MRSQKFQFPSDPIKQLLACFMNFIDFYCKLNIFKRKILFPLKSMAKKWKESLGKDIFRNEQDTPIRDMIFLPNLKGVVQKLKVLNIFGGKSEF